LWVFSFLLFFFFALFISCAFVLFLPWGGPGGGGGGGAPLYGLLKYVWTQRVWFFSLFGHKQGIDFGHFGHKLRVWLLHSSLEMSMFIRRG